MILKHKKYPYPECWASAFNCHALCEIMVSCEDWYDTDYPENYEFWIEAEKKWMDWHEARTNNLIITDNHNTRFFEPKTIEDKLRGYTID